MKTLFTEAVRQGLAEASGKAWKKQKITLRIRTGRWAGDHAPSEPLPAYVRGVWAVHKPSGGGREWSVTHIPSGAHFTGPVDTLKQAKAGIDQMIEAIPEALNMSEADVHSRSSEMMRWAKKIRGW